MAIGPGKYDDLATLARERAEASAVILIVLAGKLGSGFSVQTENLDVSRVLPALLRSLAHDIERDLKE